MPKHVAIIMDGNGRWAKSQGKQRFSGHQAGVETVKQVLKWAIQRDIEVITLFAFSSENWRRPKAEVALLMELLAKSLKSERKEFLEQDIQLRVIGEVSGLPKRLVKQIDNIVAETSDRAKIICNIAINYGGRWDIVEAARKLAQQVADGQLSIDAIDETTLDGYISTGGLPEPDLLIRTGGEQRISNFLNWQLAYAELYFTDVYWPDFSEQDFDSALTWFAQRQRRFGKTGDQLEAASA